MVFSYIHFGILFWASLQYTFSGMRSSASCLNPSLEGRALNLGYATLGRLANVLVALPASSLWGTRFWLPVSCSYGETSRTVWKYHYPTWWQCSPLRVCCEECSTLLGCKCCQQCPYSPDLSLWLWSDFLYWSNHCMEMICKQRIYFNSNLVRGGRN